MGEVSSEIARILAYLKGEIKRRELTYDDVATCLGKSQATVKRLLNSGQLSLDEIESLAGLIGLSLGRLLAIAATPQLETVSLTHAQEAALAANPPTITYYFRLRDGVAPAQIEKDAGISHMATRRYLRYLEDHGLIEVLPGDKVKLPNNGWRLLFLQNGPLNGLLFPRRLAVIKRHMDERGQPNVFAPAATQGWLGRYMTMHLTPPQYLEMLAESEDLFRRWDLVSASNTGEAGRETVTITAYVDRYDMYEGVMPEICEL